MNWGRIQLGLLKPETTEEVKEQATLDGMRRAIEMASRDSVLIRQCLDSARYAGLSGEDKYVLLAYQALLALEEHWQRNLRFSELSPNVPPIVIKDEKVI